MIIYEQILNLMDNTESVYSPITENNRSQTTSGIGMFIGNKEMTILYFSEKDKSERSIQGTTVNYCKSLTEYRLLKSSGN